jgi:hypothetical protein
MFIKNKAIYLILIAIQVQYNNFIVNDDIFLTNYY